MKGQYRLTRSVASVAALLSAGGLAGFQLAAAPSANAAVSNSTWSGAGRPADDPSGVIPGSDWSDANNWSAGAPSNGSTIGTLKFPDLTACDSQFQSNGTLPSSCYTSNNDLTGITAGTLEVDNPPADTWVDSGGNTQYMGGYSIEGNGITVTNGLNVTGDSGTTTGGMITTPLTLAAPAGAPTGAFSQSWSMLGSSIDIGDNVTGPLADVTVASSQAPSTSTTNLQLDGAVETHSFTFAGQDTNQTGVNAATNGFLLIGQNGAGDLNGVNGNPVNIDNSDLVGAGSVGKLAVNGGSVSVDVGGVPGTMSTIAANFDSKSALYMDVNGVSGSTTATAGTNYSQLTSSGAVVLGDATNGYPVLSLQAPNSVTCVDPAPGTVYTLISAASLTGDVVDGYNTQNGVVADGGTVSMPNCAGTSTDQFRINCNRSSSPATLTATALDPTTTTVAAANYSPQVNQQDLVTVTVTAASKAVPTGTVSFLAQSPTSATNACQDVPLDGNGQATCEVTFGNSGASGVYATYTPKSGTLFASSNGNNATPINVQPVAISGTSGGDSESTSDPNTPATATASDSNISATASGGTGTVTAANYASNPTQSAPTFNSNGTYFDVQVSSGSSFKNVSISVPNVPSGGAVYWYDSSSSTWTKVVGDSGSTLSPYVAVIDSNSSPTVTQLAGTVFAVANPGSAPTPPPPSGTSPFKVAVQGRDGGLWTVGPAGTKSWGVGLASGTSPSVLTLPNGGYEVAFQANGGHLWTVGTAGWKDWGVGLAPGTSPSISQLSNGGYEVAFQGYGGQLWTVGTAGWKDWGVGLESGTSPSVLSLPNGGYEIAFQANGGHLWTVGTAGWKDWGVGLAPGTSPSTESLSGGGYEVAFQAYGGHLWTVGSAGWKDWNLGMAANTSPAIERLANGGYEVAFQANGGHLWTVGTAGWKDWNLGMATATSPSELPVGNSGYEVGFQANGGQLWTVGAAGWTDWPVSMADSSSPSLG